MPQDPMLFAHLESFVEVARRGNVSRAAEALFLTQPAITARLKILEKDLGVELFVRTGRGMKLSDAGRAFLPYAELAVSTVDEGRQLVANLQEGSVAARHPFASRGKVRMDELAAERLILFDRTSSYRELTSSLFRQAGVVPASTLELDNVEAAKKMVQQGLGVALLPRMALAVELKARSLRPVKLVGAPTVRRPIVALRRKDAGEPIGPVAGFLETLHEVLG